MKTTFAATSRTGAVAGALSMILAAFGSASQSHAQIPGTSTRVSVPFSFHVGEKVLMPGVYTIRQENGSVMEVLGTRVAGLTIARPELTLTTIDKGKVIFRKYGDQYFLREVWAAGRNEHQVCLRSKAERALQIAKVERKGDGTEMAILELPR